MKNLLIVLLSLSFIGCTATSSSLKSTSPLSSEGNKMLDCKSMCSLSGVKGYALSVSDVSGTVKCVCGNPNPTHTTDTTKNLSISIDE